MSAIQQSSKIPPPATDAHKVPRAGRISLLIPIIILVVGVGAAWMFKHLFMP